MRRSGSTRTWVSATSPGVTNDTRKRVPGMIRSLPPSTCGIELGNPVSDEEEIDRGVERAIEVIDRNEPLERDQYRVVQLPTLLRSEHVGGAFLGDVLIVLESVSVEGHRWRGPALMLTVHGQPPFADEMQM